MKTNFIAAQDLTTESSAVDEAAPSETIMSAEGGDITDVPEVNSSPEAESAEDAKSGSDAVNGDAGKCCSVRSYLKQ